MMLSFAIALAASIKPTSPEVSNVVFTLIRGGDDLKVFEERNNCLKRAISSGAPYDSIAFHEGNVPAADQERLVAQNPNLRFIDVHEAFTVPADGARPPPTAPLHRPSLRPPALHPTM